MSKSDPKSFVFSGLSTVSEYVMGGYARFKNADTLPQGLKGIVCPGPNVTAGQFYDVVVKDLRDHPAMRDLPASFFAGAALGLAFPCKH